MISRLIDTIQRTLMLLAVVASGTVAAETLDVGGQDIEIPIPSTLKKITPDMTPYYEVLKAYSSPESKRYMTLIESDDARTILEGGKWEIDRYINIETAIELESLSITSEVFNDFRDFGRQEYEETSAEIDPAVSEGIKDGDAELNEQFALGIAKEIGGIFRLPIHQDDEQTIAHSKYLTVNTSIDGESDGGIVVAATTISLWVSERIVFIFVCGTESDLEWTRSTASDLAKAILAANSKSTDELQEALEN